tara:strand:+ start:64 stop:531 length:468 start_codon:yes stop_codon:yes gene_type:complete
MFKDDLKQGESLEMYLLNKIHIGNTPIFGEPCPDAYKMQGYFKYYDIWIPEFGVAVEVKGDKKSLETGNFLIEVEMGGKPSALSTTKAQYWVFYDGEYEIWTTPDRIRQAVKGLPLRDILGRGDSTWKKGYLPTKNQIKKYAEFIIPDNYYAIHS